MHPTKICVTHLTDQLWTPTPTYNAVDETRRDSHIDLECLAPALAIKDIISVCSLSLT